MKPTFLDVVGLGALLSLLTWAVASLLRRPRERQHEDETL